MPDAAAVKTAKCENVSFSLCAMEQLNAVQKAAFNSIIQGVNTGIFGGAGCGKSFLLRQVAAYLGEERLTVCAMTGVASHLLGARTLHSVLHLGRSDGRDRRALTKSITDRPEYVTELCELSVLAVDEVSMLSSELFLAIDEMLQTVRNCSRLWGGIQLVFVGDFNQLQPVDGTSLLQCDQFLSGFPNQYYLRENFRQKGHDDFYQLLQRISQGKMTDADHAALRARVGIKPPSSAVHIYGLKTSVDQHNRACMAKLEGPSVEFKPTFGERMSAKAREALLNSSPVPPVLAIKANARVMMVANIDVAAGKVNGTFGTIVDPAVPTWIMDGSDVVEKVERATWYFDSNRRNTNWMSAIPLVLAFSSTVHKAQGLTLPCFVAEVNPRQMFASGQFYVLLGRVRSISDAYLTTYTPGCDRANQAALDFYQSLAGASAERNSRMDTNI